MEDDARRWDTRWADSQPSGPEPPDALVAAGLLDELATSGRALDVACGRGGQTVWAAERGLDVIAIDVSQRAVDLTRDAARLGGVESRVEVRRVDLDGGLPGDATGLVLVVCQRFRDPRLYRPLVESLDAGGLAVVTVLSRDGAAEPGPFHAPPDELTDAFGALADEGLVRVVAHHGGDGEESIVVRRT